MFEYGQGLASIYDASTPVHHHAEGHRFPRDAEKTALIASEILRVGRSPRTPPPGPGAYAEAPPPEEAPSLAGTG